MRQDADAWIAPRRLLQRRGCRGGSPQLATPPGRWGEPPQPHGLTVSGRGETVVSHGAPAPSYPGAVIARLARRGLVVVEGAGSAAASRLGGRCSRAAGCCSRTRTGCAVGGWGVCAGLGDLRRAV